MACSFLFPILVTLLAPAEAAPTPTDDATSATDAAAPTEAAPAPAPAPASDVAAEPAPAETAPPADVTNPFDAPPPTANPAPTPIAPIPPPPARPIRWRLDFGLGTGATVVGDLGYRAFADNRTLLHLDTSAIFDFRLAEGRFFLGGGVAYGFARRIDYAYGDDLSTYLGLHEPRVVGRASFMAIEGVDVFARAGVGPSFVDFDFESSYGTYDYDSNDYGYQVAYQRAVLPRVDGQAGLSLYLPKRWLPRKQASRVGAGLELSMGYTWRGNVEVRPPLDRTDDPLRVTAPNWGDLSLRGLSWGLGLFVRVM